MSEIPAERSAVLVVDDDDAIRVLVSRVLRREQFETGEASNGQQALEQLRTARYGTIVLDLMMPIMNGVEVVRYLDQTDDLGDPCVIVMSAASERHLTEVASPRVHAVIRKPFDLPELVAAVRKCHDHE